MTVRSLNMVAYLHVQTDKADKPWHNYFISDILIIREETQIFKEYAHICNTYNYFQTRLPVPKTLQRVF